MRTLGVCGVRRRKGPRTTFRDDAHRPAPDLVARDFAAAGPDRLWVADITYIPTWAGFLSLAVVGDAWSRRVIGWAMEAHLRTELVLAALDMAVEQRQPVDVIHHSDQGCQYTSIAFGLRCREAGVRPSMGSVGDAYDNALCESFFATLECELLDRQSFSTQTEARRAVFDFLEGWYNLHRRHSALGYLSPAEFEKRAEPPCDVQPPGRQPTPFRHTPPRPPAAAPGPPFPQPLGTRLPAHHTSALHRPPSPLSTPSTAPATRYILFGLGTKSETAQATSNRPPKRGRSSRCRRASHRGR